MMLYAASTMWIMVIGWVILKIAKASEVYQDDVDPDEISNFSNSELATCSQVSKEESTLRNVNLLMTPHAECLKDISSSFMLGTLSGIFKSQVQFLPEEYFRRKVN